MFNGMGIEWALTFLGCLAAVLVPVPVWFYLRGAKIREKSAFAPTFPPKPPAAESNGEQAV
jgi:DHA1 family multidrug resistance protein-like MFS transporter